VIKAAIFDLDGLLVNSQPMWEEAAAEVFGALGVPLTPENMKHAIGLRSDEEVRYCTASTPGLSRRKKLY
jgi:beta-phosphoglucomutase-like phosphatase (HAD superfamily)